MGIFSKLFGDGGKGAANAARESAGIADRFQNQALTGFQESQNPLREARDTGLQGLMSLFGGGDDAPYYQDMMIKKLKGSPLYQQLMGGAQFGEDAIMRNASATGGMRSGNVQYNLNDYNTRLANDALLQSYNQELTGIRGLANQQPDDLNIAKMINNRGTIQAGGNTAAAQAREEGRGGLFGNLMSLGKVGLKAANIGGFSDIRLKENTRYEGMHNGHRWYSWDWNDEAKALGLEGRSEGVMATEVMEYMPQAVDADRGYITVRYDMLGVD